MQEQNKSNQTTNNNLDKKIQTNTNQPFSLPKNDLVSKNNYKKPLFIALTAFLLIAVIGGWILLSSNNNKAPLTDAPRLSPKNTNQKQDTKEFTAYQVSTEPTNIAGISGEVSLGFNNAEQVVETNNGSLLVLVSDKKLLLAFRDTNGAITKTQTIASDNINLPAIAKSGNTVAIAWSEQNTIKAVVSTDNATSFGDINQIGTGAGVSLAAEGNSVMAVWHEGKEGRQPSKIMLRQYSSGAWGSASRVDSSSSTPLWASVDYSNQTIFVTWRDNREGKAYNVWLRRSLDGGKTWQAEQQITKDLSGDPDICTVDGKTIWLAHHGKTEITLHKSSDGGTSFSNPQKVGNGYFAHLSCNEKAIGIAWESTTESAKSENKKVGWAIYTPSNQLIGAKEIEDDKTAASTIYINSSNKAEVLWLKNNSSPLLGTLRHTILSLQ